MKIVKYKGKNYRTRTFNVICEGEEQTYTIAEESLSEAFGEDYDKWDENAHAIDETIYYYLPDYLIKTLSPEEICEKHLDVEMEFVEEI